MMDEVLIPEFIQNFFKSEIPEEIQTKKASGVQHRDFSGEAPAVSALQAAEIEALCKSTGIEFKKGYEGRVLTYTCSDESVDRMGDVIRQDGWNLANYLKNPVVMGFHDYNTFPVGTALKTYVKDGKLKMDILFADKDVSEDADKAFRMAKAGFMKAGSVGFVPVESHSPTTKEIKDLDMKPWGRVFDKAELLEFSVCGIPANPNAVQDMVSKGIIKAGELDGWMKKDITPAEPPPASPPPPPPPAENEEAKALISELKAALALVPTQKSGAVLSAKTKTSIQAAMTALDSAYEACEMAYEALESLLKSTEKTPDNGMVNPDEPSNDKKSIANEEAEFYVEVQRLIENTLKSIKQKRSP